MLFVLVRFNLVAFYFEEFAKIVEKCHREGLGVEIVGCGKLRDKFEKCVKNALVFSKKVGYT